MREKMLIADMLKPCPICKSRAYIEKELADGYFFGWSVGCPRFRIKDGIHAEKMSFHNCRSREAAIKKWNDWVEEYENKRRDTK